MDLLEIESLDHINLDHWYYQSKFNIFKRELKHVPQQQSLIDVGAGSAIFSHLFLKNTTFNQATAFDINYKNNKIISVYNDKKLAYAKEMTGFSADLILMMDILEHIEDDATFLKNIVNQANKGTIFFISVPAFQSIFSLHDDYLKHYRRYNKSQLNRLVLDANLQPVSIFYGFYTLFLPVVIGRILKNIIYKSRDGAPKSDMNASPNLTINSFLKCCHKHEPFIKNPLFGLTCFCVAKNK